MVFSINAPTHGDQTFDKFLERAKGSTVTDGSHNIKDQKVLGALGGAEDVSGDDKKLLLNSYILLGLVGGVLLLLIVVIIFVARGGGRSRAARAYAPLVLPNKGKKGEKHGGMMQAGDDEFSCSLTHPQGETRYGD